MSIEHRMAKMVVASIVVLLGLVGGSVVASATPAGAPPMNYIDVSTAVDGESGSLRDAFVQADASPGDDTIVLNPALGEYRLDKCDGSEFVAGALLHRRATTVRLEGRGSVIRQRCVDRVIEARHRDGSLVLREVTITGGIAADGYGPGGQSGGGVYAAGALTLGEVEVSGNRANEWGGGIFASGALTARDSLVRDNTASSGGGVIAWGGANVRGSTFVGNRGGGIYVPSSLDSSPLTLSRSTVTGNTGGGVKVELFGGPHQVDVLESTVADNVDAGGFFGDLSVSNPYSSGGPADPPSQVVMRGSALGTCRGANRFITFLSDGANASEDASCSLTHVTDRASIGDLRLQPLAENGGPTPTMLPAPDSPLLDAIVDCEAAGIQPLDQRGEPRPMGAGCDIGAAEAPGAIPVDVPALADGVPGSLRAHVTEANVEPGPATLRLAAGATYELDVCGDDDANAAGDIDATDPAGLAIIGRRARIVQTCGDRAVHAVAGPLALSDVEMVSGGGIEGGDVQLRSTAVRDVPGPAVVADRVLLDRAEVRENGAGIVATTEVVGWVARVRDNAGLGIQLGGGDPCASTRVELIDSVVRDNEQGIVAGEIRLTNSTVAENGLAGGAAPAGGGVRAGASLVAANSTVVANRATTAGGGVQVGGCGGTPTADLHHVTLASNEAPSGANLAVLPEVAVALGATAIADPIGGGTDCDRTVGPAEHSFASDGSCGLGDGSINAGGSAQLSPLTWKRGRTPVRVPAAASPLVDEVWGCSSAPPIAFDQRGVARAQGAWCDIGAVEVERGATFTDVAVGWPSYYDVECLAALDVTDGYPDGSFRPYQSISRAAVAAWLWRLSGSPAGVGSPSFDDVPATHPFAEAIAWMDAEGITTGYSDGTFRPNGTVTRAAVAAWMWRLAGEPEAVDPPELPDVPPSHPFASAVYWLVDSGIAPAEESFWPENSAIRAELAGWFCRYEGLS